MRYLTSDILGLGLIIGTLLFCAIQLSGIAVRLREISHALTILTINELAPDVVREVNEEILKGEQKE